MEHEIEKVIRAKTIAAEATLTDWNSDRVWQNISLPRKSHRPAHILYASAACIAAAIILLAYMLPHASQMRLQTQINTLQKRIALKAESQNKLRLSAGATRIAEVPCPEIATRRSGPVASRIHKKPEIAAGFKTEMIASPPAKREPIMHPSEIPEVKPGPLDIAAFSPPEKTIVAIVGVIQPERTVMVVKTKRKKIKIDFTPKPDQHSVAAAPEESRSFSARLN